MNTRDVKKERQEYTGCHNLRHHPAEILLFFSKEENVLKFVKKFFFYELRYRLRHMSKYSLINLKYKIYFHDSHKFSHILDFINLHLIKNKLK